MKNLISLESRVSSEFFRLSTVNSFPLRFKTSPRRGSIVPGTQELDRTDPQRGWSLRSSPASARVSARVLRRLLFTAGFPTSPKFSGRYISLNCKKQKGNKEARQKFWKKGWRTLCARVCFVKLVQFSSSSVNFSY